MSDIKEQWQQDVADYGDNAFLMWEGYAGGVDEYECWIEINNNECWYYPTDIRRKDSAALPFDLERAKSGDVVEYKNKSGIWEDVLNFSLFNYDGFYIVNTYDFMSHSWVRDDNLRMKFPPKVNNASPKN